MQHVGVEVEEVRSKWEGLCSEETSDRWSARKHKWSRG